MITTTEQSKRTYLGWTADEVAYLTANYCQLTEDELRANLQNRNWHSIVKKAEKLKLERTCFRHAKLENLLQDTPEAFYWMGFLCADGNFTERRIALAVATKDLDHLKSFLSFVESTNEIGEPSKGYHRVKLTNVSAVSQLRARFGIHNNKTHNPCHLSWMNPEQFTAFIIGFIDGDGCVSQCKNSYTLSVVGHSSWLMNFIMMQSFLYLQTNEVENVSSPKIKEVSVKLPQNDFKSNFSQARWYISRKPILHWLRRRADELKLPFLQRKLGKIIL